MIEMLRRVLNPQWLGGGIVERTPNYIEQIIVCELRCLVPLIRREADGLTTASAFDLNATNTGHRITVPGLRISRTKAAHIKTNLQMDELLYPQSSSSQIWQIHYAAQDFRRPANNPDISVVDHNSRGYKCHLYCEAGQT